MGILVRTWVDPHQHRKNSLFLTNVIFHFLSAGRACLPGLMDEIVLTPSTDGDAPSPPLAIESFSASRSPLATPDTACGGWIGATADSSGAEASTAEFHEITDRAAADATAHWQHVSPKYSPADMLSMIEAEVQAEVRQRSRQRREVQNVAISRLQADAARRLQKVSPPITKKAAASPISLHVAPVPVHAVAEVETGEGAEADTGAGEVRDVAGEMEGPTAAEWADEGGGKGRRRVRYWKRTVVLFGCCRVGARTAGPVGLVFEYLVCPNLQLPWPLQEQLGGRTSRRAAQLAPVAQGRARV